jgi:hypothetical protein
VSDLDTSFTFRLTHDDKAILAALASQLGCDRGAALRRLIRRASPRVTAGEGGRFVAHGRALAVRLRVPERAHE